MKIHRSKTDLYKSLSICSKMVQSRQISLSNNLNSWTLNLKPSLKISQHFVLSSNLGLDQKITIILLETLKPISLLIIENTHHHSSLLVVLVHDINRPIVTKISYRIIISLVIVHLENFHFWLSIELKVFSINLSFILFSNHIRFFAYVSSHYKIIMRNSHFLRKMIFG
jgi:hypothetical protein